MTPCPICGREPKWHYAFGGWVLSCVGNRHTIAITDDGHHVATLYKAKTQDEIIKAWDRAMQGKGVA
jgi:hypothetical protein